MKEAYLFCLIRLAFRAMRGTEEVVRQDFRPPGNKFRHSLLVTIFALIVLFLFSRVLASKVLALKV